MPTAHMKPISLFVPFERVSRREEDDALIVEGYAFCNEMVPGDPRRLKRSTMVTATDGYMANGGGAVREMHGPFAAGIAHEAVWDDRGCLLRAEIVDPVARLKVEKKVYRGFSVGVNPKSINRADEVEEAEWLETSLVDKPRDRDALFLYRADGFDPDAEVEVEVLDAPADDTPSPLPLSGTLPGGEDPAPTAPAALPAPDPLPPGEVAASPAPAADEAAIAVHPILNPSPVVPSPEVGVPASAPAGGGTSLSTEGSTATEEQRAAIVEALRAAGLPEGLAASVTVTAPVGAGLIGDVPTSGTVEIPITPNAWTDGGVGLTGNITSNTVTITPAERALGAPVIAMPPNPSGEETASVEGVSKALGGGLPDDYRVEQAPTGMWCAYGPAGGKLGEFPTEAEALAHVAECRRQMSEGAARADRADRADRAQTSATVPSRENLDGKKWRRPMNYGEDEPDIERVIKKVGEKWCVYSESGEKLGEHDSREDAVKQLQAIEISKHKDEPGATQPKDEKRAAEPDPAWQAQMAQRLADIRAEMDRVEAAIITGQPIPVVEPTPTEPVSSPQSGEALQRLAESQAEVTRLQAAHTETLTRLAAAEETIQRQERLLAEPRDVPPARYVHALSREFIANLGNEGEAQIARLRQEYAEAEAEAKAERDGDIDKRNRAIERMMLTQSLLAERGVRI